DTANLAKLQPVAGTTRPFHAVTAILFSPSSLHFSGTLIGSVIPDVFELCTPTFVCSQFGIILDLNFRILALTGLHESGYTEVRGDIGDRYGNAGPCAPVEPGIFQVVQCLRGFYQWVAFSQIVNKVPQGAFCRDHFYPGVVSR